MMRHTGSNVVNSMFMEYHRHPFGDNHQAVFATVQPLPAGFNSEKRLDYDTRDDDSPVYIGFCETMIGANNLLLTPTTTDTWVIQKFTYDASNRVIRIEVKMGAWDDRASLFT
jgi:YD repeat-containing protein